MVYLLIYIWESTKRYLLTMGILALAITNMLVFRIRSLGLSSIAGEYLSILVVLGMGLRAYIAGISKSSMDYTFADGDKAIYTFAANTIIILGLTVIANSLTQYILSLILILDNARRAMKVAKPGGLLHSSNVPFSIGKGLGKELKVIALIFAIGIAIEYISFYNGAPVPLGIQ